MHTVIQLITFGLTLFANTALGLTVLLRAPKQQTNQRFALMTLSIIFWIGTLFLYYTISIQPWLLFIGRINLMAAVFVPLTAFRFVYIFPSKLVKVPRWLSLGVYLLSGFFIFATLTSLVDINEMAHGLDRSTEFGPLYGAFLFEIILICAVTIGLLIAKWKKAVGHLKAQLVYFLLGFSLLAVVAIFFNGFLPFFFNNYELQSFGSLASIFFVGFTSYAIIRHRFMDINRVVATVLIQIASFISFGIIYALVGYIIGLLFFPQILNIRYILVCVFVALCIKFALRPYGEFFEGVGSTLFARNLYTRKNILQNLQRITSSTVNLPTLIQEVLHLLVTEMKLQYMVYVGISDREIFIQHAFPLHRKPFLFSENDILSLLSCKKITFIDELEDEEIRKSFQKKGVELCIPLQNTKSNSRFLLCGTKKSGAPFYSYDVETFNLIAQPFLIAIQNARYLYDIRKFNKKLRQEVTKATKEVRRVNTQLRQADKLKDEFISIASHELKTPTTAIQGFLWLVLQKDKELSAYSRDKIDRVAKLTEHMVNLVNDMLDVSKIESKRINLAPTQLPIEQLIHEVKGELDFFAAQKHITISLPAQKNFIVWADKQRVHQIITNLINNAIKYSNTKGKVKVSFVKYDSELIVKISDNGIGIREEDMPKLFSKFGKLDNGNNTSFHLPGTGLGLYITKNLVELSGGNIWVDSIYGKGTTFSFSLPLRQKSLTSL